MRIISGSRRGHKLYQFSGDSIRPTADRVKEAVFSMINAHIRDAEVLDMFAGSGALSLEMLSRGARSAVLIDKDPRSIEVIKKNIGALKFEAQCEVRRVSCFDYAKSCAKKFDVIFLDPPYNKGLITEALSVIVSGGLLSEDGIAVLESDGTDFRDDFPGLIRINQKRYGRTYITVYKQGKPENENSCISG